MLNKKNVQNASLAQKCLPLI